MTETAELCQCGHEHMKDGEYAGLCFAQIDNDYRTCPCMRFTPPDAEAKATAKILADSEQYPEGPEAHLAEVMLDERRDWTEDFSHENGQYQCRCIECKQLFTGHKRRVICKACAKPPVDEREKVVAELSRKWQLREGGGMGPGLRAYHRIYETGANEGFDAGYAARDAEVERLKERVKDLESEIEGYVIEAAGVDY